MSEARGENEQYHVVLVGRSGGHAGTNIYLTGPGLRRQAVATGEATFRHEQRLASNVALVARVVFSGGEAEGVAFIDRLTSAIEADDASTDREGCA